MYYRLDYHRITTQLAAIMSVRETKNDPTIRTTRPTLLSVVTDRFDDRLAHTMPEDSRGTIDVLRLLWRLPSQRLLQFFGSQDRRSRYLTHVCRQVV
jgi:hypothetical protein